MSEQPTNTPQDDAERIRLKRLAKLQASSSSSSPSPSPAPQPEPQPKAIPKPSPKPTPKPTPVPTPPPPQQQQQPQRKAPVRFDLSAWEHSTLSQVLKVTLDKEEAEKSGHELVWLKSLSQELEAENPDGPKPIRMNADLIDRLLIARLELDPNSMSDDLEFLPVLASLPAQQTIFEYLVGSWKRINSARSALLKKGYTPVDTEKGVLALDKIRNLIISYAGLTLQEPEMFPQPSGKPIGPPELVASLLTVSTFTAPLLTATAAPNTLGSSDIELFLQDLARRFEPDGELEGVLGDAVRQLLFHTSLFRPEGLGGGDSSWRAVIGGLEALVSVKPIAVMITQMADFIPSNATAANFEILSLMGPLCRLGVFSREWPGIAQTYFSEAEKRSRNDVESSFANLRGTLKSLQSSLFQIFNTLVRASAEARESVLEFFATVISLNVKRTGMQVDFSTVSSDSFMVNLQSVMLRFSEPFIDASYSKLDRIDPLFYTRSSRINLKEETRIKATNEEVAKWDEENKPSGTEPAPNFISNIFFLTVAMSHFGYLRTIQHYMELPRHVEDIDRHLNVVEGDGTWRESPHRARIESAINNIKNEKAKIQAELLAYETGLQEPELLFRSVGFSNFLSVWVLRQVDPKKSHPKVTVELPLPQEVPMAFRVLPEYIIEDIVDMLHFVVQTSPESMELSGKTEVLIFALTFLTSTWYIKNPFLKSKINDILFYGSWPYNRRSRQTVLGDLLNTHPMALKHLIPALTHFYIEVEQTGASSQFYDKFNARRNIAFVLKNIWDNPSHREALNREALNVDKFVRFVNLMINDVTYLMDESLSDLKQIHEIQLEMDDQATWASKTVEYRREREAHLRTLERQASGYTTLGRSTVELLKIFTAETKAPFMMPEIVDRLAAMLDYNLDVLVGPRHQELKVRDPEKLRFDPRALLSDIIQVYLNLSDQGEFVRAVAGDGRSYRKELFESAAATVKKRALKTEREVNQLMHFIVNVEEAKATMEAEEDLGEIPDEFLDPLMFTVMRDPVLLPTSRTIIDRSTIKSHLLSDSKDPFNRAPLKIEDVIPEPGLKARIDAFLQERRRKGTALDKTDDEIAHLGTAGTLAGESPMEE